MLCINTDSYSVQLKSLWIGKIFVQVVLKQKIKDYYVDTELFIIIFQKAQSKEKKKEQQYYNWLLLSMVC